MQGLKCKPLKLKLAQLLASPKARFASILFCFPSTSLTMKLLSSWVVAALAAQAAGAALSHKFDGFTIREHADPAKRDLLQKYVCLTFLP